MTNHDRLFSLSFVLETNDFGHEITFVSIYSSL